MSIEESTAVWLEGCFEGDIEIGLDETEVRPGCGVLLPGSITDRQMYPDGACEEIREMELRICLWSQDEQARRQNRDLLEDLSEWVRDMDREGCMPQEGEYGSVEHMAVISTFRAAERTPTCTVYTGTLQAVCLYE